MSTELCNITNCVRRRGHAGCHTACPSSATLDWDRNYTSPTDPKYVEAAITLFELDFETPYWADLNDKE